MRELTLNEVEAVNGGNPVVVGAAIVVGGAAALAIVGFGAGLAVAYFFY